MGRVLISVIPAVPMVTFVGTFNVYSEAARVRQSAAVRGNILK